MEFDIFKSFEIIQEIEMARSACPLLESIMNEYEVPITTENVMLTISIAQEAENYEMNESEILYLDRLLDKYLSSLERYAKNTLKESLLHDANQDVIQSAKSQFEELKSTIINGVNEIYNSVSVSKLPSLSTLEELIPDESDSEQYKERVSEHLHILSLSPALYWFYIFVSVSDGHITLPEGSALDAAVMAALTKDN